MLSLKAAIVMNYSRSQLPTIRGEVTSSRWSNLKGVATAAIFVVKAANLNLQSLETSEISAKNAAAINNNLSIAARNYLGKQKQRTKVLKDTGSPNVDSNKKRRRVQKIHHTGLSRALGRPPRAKRTRKRGRLSRNNAMHAFMMSLLLCQRKVEQKTTPNSKMPAIADGVSQFSPEKLGSTTAVPTTAAASRDDTAPTTAAAPSNISFYKSVDNTNSCKSAFTNAPNSTHPASVMQTAVVEDSCASNSDFSGIVQQQRYLFGGGNFERVDNSFKISEEKLADMRRFENNREYLTSISLGDLATMATEKDQVRTTKLAGLFRNINRSDPTTRVSMCMELMQKKDFLEAFINVLNHKLLPADLEYWVPVIRAIVELWKLCCSKQMVTTKHLSFGPEPFYWDPPTTNMPQPTRLAWNCMPSSEALRKLQADSPTLGFTTLVFRPEAHQMQWPPPMQLSIKTGYSDRSCSQGPPGVQVRDYFLESIQWYKSSTNELSAFSPSGKARLSDVPDGAEWFKFIYRLGPTPTTSTSHLLSNLLGGLSLQNWNDENMDVDQHASSLRSETQKKEHDSVTNDTPATSVQLENRKRTNISAPSQSKTPKQRRVETSLLSL